MHQRLSGINVFFPAFNDERTIETMVAQALTVLPTLIDNFEVIVINDGSRDAAEDVLGELAHAWDN